MGRRIQRTSSAGTDERFVYDGQDVLLDLNSSLTVATSYLNGLGIDDHLRQTNTATGVSYYLTDHLDSTSALTDASGTVVEQLSYDSFGNNSGSIRTRYTYTGREFDSDAGLYYYRTRSYDPPTGRFVSEDSIGLKGGFNLYAYTENDPVNGFDPFGEDVIAIFDRRKGTMKVTDKQTGKRIVIRRVFSGYGECSNKPACDSIKDTGPVPAGDYLIGKSYIPNKHRAQSGDYHWYRLFGPNGKGGYSYTDVPVRGPGGNTVIRGGFNIHTGSYSEGCITVESDTSWWNPLSTYPESASYSQLREMLDNTSPLLYKGYPYRGKLTVK